MTSTTAELGVPEGLHHFNLEISEDRLVVTRNAGKAGDKGCALSGKLEKGMVHTLELTVEKASVATGLYLGVCRAELDGRPDPGWSMLSFHNEELCDNYIGLKAEKHYNPPDIAALFSSGAVILKVDMLQGRTSIEDTSGKEHGYWDVPELPDTDVRFAASFASGMAFTSGFQRVAVVCPAKALQLDAQKHETGLTITCTSMAGNFVGEFTQVDPQEQCSSLAKLIRERIPPPPGTRWKIVLPNAECLDESKLGVTLADLFGLPALGEEQEVVEGAPLAASSQDQEGGAGGGGPRGRCWRCWRCWRCRH